VHRRYGGQRWVAVSGVGFLVPADYRPPQRAPTAKTRRDWGAGGMRVPRVCAGCTLRARRSHRCGARTRDVLLRTTNRAKRVRASCLVELPLNAGNVLLGRGHPSTGGVRAGVWRCRNTNRACNVIQHSILCRCGKVSVRLDPATTKSGDKSSQV
jgi:hypothetical protein